MNFNETDFNDSRLDKYIKRMYGKLIPQSIIEKALRNKDILVNGKKAKSNDRVTENDDIFVHSSICKMFADLYCEQIDKTQEKQKINIDYSLYKKQFEDMIIYEDDDFVIINKNSGLAVQLGSKIKISVDVMAKEYNSNLRLVHRIDKETSGITILAKNIETSRYMLYLFKNKQIQKKYLAIISGRPPYDQFTINKPLFRNKETVLVDYDKGKEAITEFKILKKLKNNKTLISANPKTGRTHQIRVHMQSIDCPILGDKKYNGKKYEYLCLHAYEISFIKHNGKRINIKAQIPNYFE